MPDKAVWVPSRETLIVSDLHIGKIEHFRNNGIGLPIAAGLKTMHTLVALIDAHLPKRVIFLGDLFHSFKNDSVAQLASLTLSTPQIQYDLVIGNHDIMNPNEYMLMNINVHEELYLDTWWLTHEPQEEVKDGFYNVAGHIHPGIRLKGQAKQSMVLPCFYFGKEKGILPAFGYFTGKFIVKIEKNTNIFVVGNHQIFKIETP